MRIANGLADTNLPASVDVVIVGAGPTGLVLGAVLAKQGISLLLLDKQAEGANTSRAVVVHARTLEMLEELEVAERLCAQGHVVPHFTIRDRDQALATIHFDGLPTRYPFTLMIPQNETEATLLERLRELGGDVRRPCAVTGVRQDASGVEVDVAAGAQPACTVRARYVIGADGMHSVVRENAGIGFIGGSYEESFVLADVRMDWPLRDDDVSLFYSAQGLVVVAPLRGGLHRLVATMDDAPASPGLADAQKILDERGPVATPARVHEVLWSSRFQLHHRVADRYRAGRILIAGDAAHVHSPAGGQGMNTGIQDAVVLAHVMAEALRTDSAEALDRYEQARRPVAEHVVAFTDRLTRLATLHNGAGQWLRNHAVRLAGSVPALRNRLAFDLSELKYR